MNNTSTLVHYLGPEGTHSHQAAKQFAEQLCLSDVKFCPDPSIVDVIKHIMNNENHFTLNLGCIPLENSIHGTVTQTWDRLFREISQATGDAKDALLTSADDFRDWQTSSLTISAALSLSIDHFLFSLFPIVDYLSVNEVRSHPQALAQCKGWLESYLPHARQVAVESTADAARQVKDFGDPGIVGIGNRIAGEIYQLSCSERPIQDNVGNVTRFGILSNTHSYLSGVAVPSYAWMRSVCLSGVPNYPGGLMSMLAVFAQAGLNLSRIESRPVGDHFGTYLFYFDIQLKATPWSENEQARWTSVLAELAELQVDVIQLGLYPMLN